MSVESEYLLLKTNQYIQKLQKCRSSVVHNTEELQKYSNYIRLLRSIQEKLRKPLALTELIDPNDSKVLQNTNTTLDNLEQKLSELRLREENEPENKNLSRLIDRVERKIENVLADQYDIKNVAVVDTPEERRINRIKDEIKRAKDLLNEQKDQDQENSEDVKEALRQRINQLTLMLVNAESNLEGKTVPPQDDDAKKLEKYVTNVKRNIRGIDNREIQFNLFFNYIYKIYNKYEEKDEEEKHRVENNEHVSLQEMFESILINDKIPEQYKEVLYDHQDLLEYHKRYTRQNIIGYEGNVEEYDYHYRELLIHIHDYWSNGGNTLNIIDNDLKTKANFAIAFELLKDLVKNEKILKRRSFWDQDVDSKKQTRVKQTFKFLLTYLQTNTDYKWKTLRLLQEVEKIYGQFAIWFIDFVRQELKFIQNIATREKMPQQTEANYPDIQARVNQLSEQKKNN